MSSVARAKRLQRQVEIDPGAVVLLALDGADDEGDDLEAIKSAQEELTTASHKLAEAMYAKSTAGPGTGPQDAGGGAAGGAQQSAGKKDDDVVDADFEEVK
jgi:hypothetical protein